MMLQKINLTESQRKDIQANKQNYIDLLLSVNRPGIEKLILWLESSDFFYAPASINNHLACFGGLCIHSLNVPKIAQELLSHFYYSASDLFNLVNSAKLAGAVHDLCKVHFYALGAEYPANDGQIYILKKNSVNLHKATPEDRDKFQKYCYDTSGELRLDMSGKTVGKLITWLTDNCKNSIPETPDDFHVDEKFSLGHGAKSLSIVKNFITLTEQEEKAIYFHMGPWDLSPYDTKSYNTAQKDPLVNIIYMADFAASHILEAEA